MMCFIYLSISLSLSLSLSLTHTHTHNHHHSQHQKITTITTSITTTKIITNNNNIINLNTKNKITINLINPRISAKAHIRSKIVKTWLNKLLTTYKHQSLKKGSKKTKTKSGFVELKLPASKNIKGRILSLENIKWCYKVIYMRPLAYICDHGLT